MVTDLAERALFSLLEKQSKNLFKKKKGLDSELLEITA